MLFPRRFFLLPLPLLAAGAAVAQAGLPLRNVAIQGRANVEEALIRSAVRLRPGSPVTAEALEADRRAILALGYFRTVTATQQAAPERRVDVTFRVSEWPRVIHLRILGNTVLDKGTIQGLLKTQRGQVLSARTLQEDIRAIEDAYREKGYVARISESILEEAVRTGILRYEVLELRIETVVVEGGSESQRKRAEELLEEIPPKLYRPADVARDQQRLQEIKGVRSAEPKVEALTPGKVKIRWMLNGPKAAEESANQN